MEYVMNGAKRVAIPLEVLEQGPEAVERWHHELDEPNAIAELHASGLQRHEVTATGADGRLTRGDVARAVQALEAATQPAEPAATTDQEG